MKKLLLFLGMFGLAAGLFAASTEAHIKTMEEVYAKNKTVWNAYKLAIYKADFPADQAAYEKFQADFIKANPTLTENSAKTAGVYALYFYAYAVKNTEYMKLVYTIATNYNMYGLKVHCGRCLNLNQKQMNALYYDYFMSKQADIKVVNGWKNSYFNTLLSIQATTAKSQLQMLNRKYTPMLLTDKANAQPFVAQIRTSLEVY